MSKIFIAIDRLTKIIFRSLGLCNNGKSNYSINNSNTTLNGLAYNTNLTFPFLASTSTSTSSEELRDLFALGPSPVAYKILFMLNKQNHIIN